MKYHSTKGSKKFTLILLVAFSVLLALGSWNPFVPMSTPQEDNNGFDLSQIYSVIFIMYLFFFRLSVPTQLRFSSWKKYLVSFYVFFVLSTIYWSLNDIDFSTGLFFLKLFLSVSLCFLLPTVFLYDIRYLYYSIACFSITCALIAFAFSIGLLEDYIRFANGRVSVFGENPNSTSGRITIAFVLLLYLIIRNPLRWTRLRYLLILLFFPMLIMIMASGSRGSFLILCLCILLFFILTPSINKFKKYLLLFCSILLLLGGIFQISLHNDEFSLFSRLENTIEEGSSGGRDVLNQHAFEIFKDFPIIGKGMLGFSKEMYFRYNETLTVHNLYLYILATTGIIGFILFTAFIFLLMTKVLNIRKKDHLPLIMMVFVCLLAYKTGGILTYLLMWYLFSIVITFIDTIYYERSYSFVSSLESIQKRK